MSATDTGIRQVEAYLGPAPPTAESPRLYADALQRAVMAVADTLHHGFGIVPVPDLNDLTTIYQALHAIRRETPETPK